MTVRGVGSESLNFVWNKELESYDGGRGGIM
jgi:hypothetical protein